MGKVGCWLSAKVGVGGHPEAQPGVGSTGIPLKRVVGRKQERREAMALPLNTQSKMSGDSGQAGIETPFKELCPHLALG